MIVDDNYFTRMEIKNFLAEAKVNNLIKIEGIYESPSSLDMI